MSYTYAADKQILSETIAGGIMQNASFTAGYDAGNRLTSWNRTGMVSPTSPQAQTWNFDDAGNWNSTTVDGDARPRTHNQADQPTAIDGNATTHDARGNLTSFQHNNASTGSVAHTLAFDPDNRLVTSSISTDNNAASYRYDAFGRRIIREYDGEKTAYLWWGNQEVSEHKHKAGQTTIQNDLWAHPTALNTLYARAVDGSKFDIQYYHKNYLDHVYAITDDSGDILEHYRYNAFGEIEIYDPTLGTRLTTTAIANHITWNTRRADPLTGYHYYLYRHYTPQLGRWPSRDPIEEGGGVNLYRFVNNNPMMSQDYLGLELEDLGPYDNPLLRISRYFYAVATNEVYYTCPWSCWHKPREQVMQFAAVSSSKDFIHKDDYLIQSLNISSINPDNDPEFNPTYSKMVIPLSPKQMLDAEYTLLAVAEEDVTQQIRKAKLVIEQLGCKVTKIGKGYKQAYKYEKWTYEKPAEPFKGYDEFNVTPARSFQFGEFYQDYMNKIREERERVQLRQEMF